MFKIFKIIGCLDTSGDLAVGFNFTPKLGDGI